MELEKQVVNLELSKKLKELGVPQESLFVWVEGGKKYGDGYNNTANDLTEQMLLFVGGESGHLGDGEMSASGERDYKGGVKFEAVGVGEYGDDNYLEYPVCCSAYTVAELGELLPRVIKTKVPYRDNDVLENWYLSYEPTEEGFKTEYTYYYYEPMDDIREEAPTEANARAAMLVYLLENKLIEV